MTDNRLPGVRSGTGAAILLALLSTCVGRAGDVPVVSLTDSATRLAALDRGPATVAVANLGRGDRGTAWPETGSEPLTPGRYRLHVAAAMAPLGTLATGPVTVRVRAGDASRDFGAVWFPADEAFVDLTVDLTVARSGPVPVRVDWQAVEGQKSRGLLGRRTLAMSARDGATGPAAEGTLDAPGDGALNDLLSDDLVAPAEARRVPFRLLVGEPWLERLAPVVLTIETDRIVYPPGATGVVTVALQNVGARPLTGTLAFTLETGLQAPLALASREVTLEPAVQLHLVLPGGLNTKGLYWGSAVRATLTVPGAPPLAGEAVVAVSSNFWETALVAAGSHTAHFSEPAAAGSYARDLKRDGFTAFECFFWGPCDMLEFTPEAEDFFSGQTAYPGTLRGTRNLVSACHDLGIAGTFYANLWGGSGPPAIELMRRHPDWFGNANYSTTVLDDWDQLGAAQADMRDRRVRAPGIASWCFAQLSLQPPAEVFACHAREILGAHRQFGWDGIRYDSFYTRNWSTRAMREVRRIVGAAAPGFGFGYNSFAQADARGLALDDLIGGGGMILAEGIRIERSRNLPAFARELLAWRDLIWAYGGHGPGMIWRDATDEEEMTDVGREYQAAIILAAGGHPYYGRYATALGDPPRFALRHSGLLFDNRLRALAAPEQVVMLDAPERFLEWQEFARTRTLDTGRQRLVLHLIPKPAHPDPYGDKAQKRPPPIRDLAVCLALPADARNLSATALYPNRYPASQALSVAAGAAFIVPEVHYWTVVAVEFDAVTPLPVRVTAKERTDTYLQDWMVAGVFANDLQMSATNTVYPPERGVDLQAAYAVEGSEPIRWRRTRAPGAPAIGRLPLDFREALGARENRPGCAYAYTEVHAERAAACWLMGKADDTLQLWVNGEQVAFTGGCGEFQERDEGRAAIQLLPGRNTVLVKVCEKWMAWLLAVRLTDASGDPLHAGLRLGLDLE